MSLGDLNILLKAEDDGLLDESENLVATITGDTETVLEFVIAGAEALGAEVKSITQRF